VPLSEVTADWEQSDYRVGSLLDVPPHGWGVYGKLGPGNNHKAMFTFARPLSAKPRVELTVRLRHESTNAGYIVGRFRLSLTTASPPRLER
jgi:hypothetical protein